MPRLGFGWWKTDPHAYGGDEIALLLVHIQQQHPTPSAWTMIQFGSAEVTDSFRRKVAAAINDKKPIHRVAFLPGAYDIDKPYFHTQIPKTRREA
jgi:hypothetical protein